MTAPDRHYAAAPGQRGMFKELAGSYDVSAADDFEALDIIAHG